MTDLVPLAPDIVQDLPFMDMRAAVEPAVQRGADRSWSLTDLKWDAIQPQRLSPADIFVVRFTTFIEDHIPGYLTSLLDTFPVSGQDIDIEAFCTNREYFRFLIAWAYDEQRHASALTRYQVTAGIAGEESLLRELAEQGRKQFQELPTHPLEAFVYTMVQEKATHLFYQRFQSIAEEPVLRELLRLLGRDEARHFALYNNLVAAYLRRHGTSALGHIKHVLQTFRMPLTATLTDYWKWSVCAPKAVRVDITEAYEPVARLVRDFVDAPGDPDVDDLLTFIAAMRKTS